MTGKLSHSQTGALQDMLKRALHFGDLIVELVQKSDFYCKIEKKTKKQS